ncbi:hypothetical protein LQT98_20505 [Chromobacterium aquaticum]|uniref:Uncharacterized protein n=1 Tax=Chromobacterium aquaticum TaxID=467180 RepID=A0ABV8ZUQ4_9NEIS|nr:hypothetical protein [Chromobacterium aquaticum]MCD5364063.1 hypothetical protein [Chromobacterium aquaticum]
MKKALSIILLSALFQMSYAATAPNAADGKQVDTPPVVSASDLQKKSTARSADDHDQWLVEECLRQSCMCRGIDYPPGECSPNWN